MVRIPGPETVTRARLTPDPGADVREGAEAIGKGLQSLGTGIATFAKAEKTREDRLEASRRAAELARLETEGIRRIQEIFENVNLPPRPPPTPGREGSIKLPPGAIPTDPPDPGFNMDPRQVVPELPGPDFEIEPRLLPPAPPDPEPVPPVPLPALPPQPGNLPLEVSVRPAPVPSGPPGPAELAPPFNRALTFGERAAAAIDKIVAGVQDPEQREKLRLRLTRFQRSLAVGVARQQQVEEGEAARRIIDANSRTFLFEIERDPSLFAEVSALALDAIADPDLRLTLEERGERAAMFEKAAVKTALFATIRDDPAQADQALESGHLNVAGEDSGGGGGDGKIKLAQFLTEDEQRDARTVLEAKKRDVQRQAMEAAVERDKEIAGQLEATASDLRIKIAGGEAGEADVEIASQTGGITVDQRTELILTAQRKAEQAERDRAQIARVDAVIQNKEGAIRNPADPEFRASVDKYYTDVLEKALDKLEASGKLTPEDRKQVRLEFTGRVGVIPKPLLLELSGKLVSTDPDEQFEAADAIARLAIADPNLISQFDQRKRNIAQLIFNLKLSGVSREDAVRLANLQTTNLPPAEIEFRGEIIKRDNHSIRNSEFIRNNLKSTPPDLAGAMAALNPAPIALPPAEPPTKIPDRLTAEFDKITRARFLETGDLNTSQQLAMQDIKRLWSVTTVGGPRRWMKFAPEAKFRPFRDPSRDGAWIQEQLEDFVLGLGVEGVAPGSDPVGQLGDPKRIRIVADPRTLSESVPRYLLFFEGKKKELVPILSPEDGEQIRWTPDFETSPEAARIDRQDKQLIESEKERFDFLRKKAKRSRMQVQKLRTMMGLQESAEDGR